MTSDQDDGRSSRRVVLAGLVAGAGGLLPRAAFADDKKAAPTGDSNLTLGTSPGPSDLVTFEQRDHVALIGINRPDKHNRLDPETYRLLSKAYYRFENDPLLRAAVLFGHGPHFSRGIDVEAFEAAISTGVEQKASQQEIDPFGKSEARLSKPVVAVAHGDTWNIGHELCLAADVRVAASNAKFGQTEASQARMPGSGATIRFVRDAGWGNAMRYMLTGDYWDAQEAKRMGLFQEIAPDAEAALELGIELAIKMAACAPLSVRATLASAHLAVDQDADRALLALNAQRQQLYATRDFKEGLMARREGRAPVYEGR